MSPTITPGRVVTGTNGQRTGQVLSPEAALANALQVPAGMFAVNLGGVEPWFVFGTFTGRTRRQWGEACPTINLFACDTVAVEAGDTFALWGGVPGVRIPGVWLTSPRNVTR